MAFPVTRRPLGLMLVPSRVTVWSAAPVPSNRAASARVKLLFRVAPSFQLVLV